MYFFPILFFASLVGLVILFGRKLALVKKGSVEETEHSHPFVLDFRKIKYLTAKNGKKYAYLSLFMVLRFYIKSYSFMKKQSLELLQKIKNRLQKDRSRLLPDSPEKAEVSKYLRMISDYRHKIKRMKHLIKKEEGIEE